MSSFPELGSWSIASSSFFLLFLISRMDCRNSSRFTFPSRSRSVSFIQLGTYGWKFGKRGKGIKGLHHQMGKYCLRKWLNMQKTKNIKKERKRVSPKSIWKVSLRLCLFNGMFSNMIFKIWQNMNDTTEQQQQKKDKRCLFKLVISNLNNNNNNNNNGRKMFFTLVIPNLLSRSFAAIRASWK